MALFGSCASDDTIFENNQKENSIRFTASIEGSIDTRATLVSNKPNWDAGDIICIDGHDYEASSPGVTTTFTGTGATEATHHAYFPASIYNGGIPTLPAVQSYEEGKFNMPMYAESTTEELEFKNICTVLAVSVSNADIDQVKAIKVASTTKALSGAFTVASDGTMTMTAPDDANKTVTLTFATAVPMTSEEKVFYIAIPAQTYSDLKIYMSSDGASFTKCMATKKAEGLGALARNKILNIPYETNAVQLWTDGPFFATMNVGATKTNYSAASDYSIDVVGGTYHWGGKVSSGSDYYTGDGDLSGNDDTATALWGACWSMPTREDFNKLRNNSTGSTQQEDQTLPLESQLTTWAWCDGESTQYCDGCSIAGYKITGKGTFGLNTIFLPAAGYDNNAYSKGKYGDYWTATRCSSSHNCNTDLSDTRLKSHRLNIQKTNIDVNWEASQTRFYSIRAVLK